MDKRRDNQNQGASNGYHMYEVDGYDRRPTLPFPIYNIDQWETQLELRAINYRLPLSRYPLDGYPLQDSSSTDEILTRITPAISKLDIPVEDISDIMTIRVPITDAVTSPQKAIATDEVDYLTFLCEHIKNAGIYAIASVAFPLISLVLAPFLTHALSLTDYGILTILTTFISLAAGITQLGLGSAFFRAYGYDYTSPDDRRGVLATTTSLLCLISILIAAGGVMLAPFIAGLLFNRSSLGSIVALAVSVVVLQNLTVPGFAWMRAAGRALYFSLLSIGSIFITLITNLVLVGGLHLGIAGAVMATGSGYAGVIVCTMPFILVRGGIRIRVDIAKSMLAFGVPMVLNVVSYWVLQLSDRYLLSLFGSLAETARYATAYTLGSVMSVLVMGPFTLVWPTTMYAIAKRKDAPQVFKLVFRWFSMFLLFAAFGLSIVGTIILDWFFPVSYHSAASVIPIVNTSIAFYGVYYVFTVGSNLTRKTWLASIFTTTAAVVNVALNLFLIPRYQAIGAAASTLIAYIILALVAYTVNQRIYHIPFEAGRFMVALSVGIAFYVGSSFLASSQGTLGGYSIQFGALALYGLCLVILARLPAWS